MQFHSYRFMLNNSNSNYLEKYSISPGFEKEWPIIYIKLFYSNHLITIQLGPFFIRPLLEARADPLKKLLVFWSRQRHQKDISKLSDL